MLTRNVVLVFSLLILLVEGDLDSNDKDSTSDEAPTDEPQYYGGGPSEDESSDSEEGGKKKFSSRSAKPQSPIQPQQPPTSNRAPPFPP
ncbi:uncharacterized protein AKAME5_002245800 [Lates japonicus]|uniref:Uncharacterized protein n=1 Tax=Lates japonicus TaxID=270547 RepID=A0AAD3NFX5_LATJO|nr:uncharacterized protein AKAME5_002245800 [Lates japonicus]